MNDVSRTPMPENVETWSGKSRGDENFPVGSLLISRRLRPHIHAYYDFARNADDIADSPDLAPQDKIDRLNVMEEVLLGKRLTGSPSAAKLRLSLTESRVNPVHATDLLIAFRQDALKSRYETFDELYRYCRYSAVPVGRYVIDLHGESPRCYGPSDALCIALQVLNHIQDCAKDLRDLDRCYIPQTLMRHFGVSERDVRQAAESQGLRRAFITMLDRVDRLNLAAEELPEMVKSNRLRAETMFICRLSIRLAARLSKGDPLAARVGLTKTDALFAGLRAFGALVWR